MNNFLGELNILKINSKVAQTFSRQIIAENKLKFLEAQKYLKGFVVKNKSTAKTFERVVITKKSMINLVFLAYTKK